MRHLALYSVFALLGVTSAPTRADEPKPEASKVEPKPADGDAPLAEGFPDAMKPGAESDSSD